MPARILPAGPRAYGTPRCSPRSPPSVSQCSPKRAKEMPKDAVILANLCGRGDKDIFTVAERLGVEM